MKKPVKWLALFFLGISVAACGVRGPLKSPSEIQQKQEKEEKQTLPPSDTGA